MIESVHFQNFKSLRDVELVGLQRLTVVVGPSGVGKTSVLQGMQVPQKGQTVSHFITRGEDQARLSYRAGGDVFALTLLPGSFKHPLGPASPRLGSHLDGPILIEFDAKRLGDPSLASTVPQLSPDGAGLATLLAYYAGADRDALPAIEAELREVIGITGRIRTFPTQLEVQETETIRIDDQLIPRTTRRQTAAHRFELEIDGLGSIPGDLLSSGTLVTLGLLALLHLPNCPSLVLLDDIDVGLHPDAQAKLIAALRKLLALRPELQILCTSHSPYLLDHFEPQEVQVLSLYDGQVVAARLDQHEDWAKWEGKLQTGEFWQSVGESWVKPTHTREVASGAE